MRRSCSSLRRLVSRRLMRSPVYSITLRRPECPPRVDAPTVDGRRLHLKPKTRIPGSMDGTGPDLPVCGFFGLVESFAPFAHRFKHCSGISQITQQIRGEMRYPVTHEAYPTFDFRNYRVRRSRSAQDDAAYAGWMKTLQPNVGAARAAITAKDNAAVAAAPINWPTRSIRYSITGRRKRWMTP